ncbi:MAG: hypothetical protein RLY85_1289 [Bacteroidota bacterium]|jgi:hypothetical protein
MKTAQLLKFFCTMLLFMSVLAIHAQSDPPPFGGTVTDEPGELPSNPPAFADDVADLVPLDGGLSLLLAAGVAFGAKKAHQYRKIKS